MSNIFSFTDVFPSHKNHNPRYSILVIKETVGPCKDSLNMFLLLLSDIINQQSLIHVNYQCGFKQIRFHRIIHLSSPECFHKVIDSHN